jgi:hypothetical protein
MGACRRLVIPRTGMSWCMNTLGELQSGVQEAASKRAWPAGNSMPANLAASNPRPSGHAATAYSIKTLWCKKQKQRHVYSWAPSGSRKSAFFANANDADWIGARHWGRAACPGGACKYVMLIPRLRQQPLLHSQAAPQTPLPTSKVAGKAPL